MTIKAQIVVSLNDDSEVLKDFYLKADKIDCWYVATEHDELGKMINVFINGECFSIKQEKHIVDYLMNTFVEKALKLSAQ